MINNLFFFSINLCFKQKEIQDSKLSVIGPFRGLCTSLCGGVVADWLTPKVVIKRRGLGILPGY